MKLLHRIMCAIGWHKWGRWSEKEIVEDYWCYGSIKKRCGHHYIQTHKCLHCEIEESRRVQI